MRLGQHRAVVWSVTNPFERTVGFDRVETSCTCSAGNLAVTELAPGATLQLELRQEAADPRGGTVSVRLIGSRGEQAHTLFLRYSIASEVPTPFVAKYLGSHLTSETIEVRLALPLPAAPDLAFARIAEADAPIAVPVSGTLTGTLVVSGVSGSSLLLEGDVRPLPDHAGALSGRYALSFMEAEYAGILLVDAVPLDATRPSGGLQAARGPVPTRVWPSPRHAFAQGAPESRLLLGFSGHRPNGLVLGDGRASNHVNVAGRNGTFGIRLRQDGFVEIDYAPSSTGSGVSGAPVEFAVLTEMLLYHVSLVEHSPDLGGPLD